jgi:FtsH-binding integral membrane protein
MKCPNCGKDISEKAKFCKECGKPILSEIDPKWKWGSMIVSLVLLAFSWLGTYFDAMVHAYSYSVVPWIILFFVGCPLVIYLMYKERKVKIKYGRAWVIVPILLMLVGLSSPIYVYNSYSQYVLNYFFFGVVPAIIIDLLAMHKIYRK